MLLQRYQLNQLDSVMFQEPLQRPVGSRSPCEGQAVELPRGFVTLHLIGRNPKWQKRDTSVNLNHHKRTTEASADREDQMVV